MYYKQDAMYIVLRKMATNDNEVIMIQHSSERSNDLLFPALNLHPTRNHKQHPVENSPKILHQDKIYNKTW